MLGRLGQLVRRLRPAERLETLGDAVASLPDPGTPPPPTEDVIGAQGDQAAGDATHAAHPELGGRDSRDAYERRVRKAES